jgi:opacity protein-like surface antigen
MRFLVCGLVLLAASPAFAGDFGDLLLRGSAQPAADPPNYHRWGGMYFGGQASVDFRGVDFSGPVSGTINNIASLDANFTGVPLTSFISLPKLNSTGAGFGGFFGYNYQIDDIVAGFEFNLNTASLNASASDSHSHGYYMGANGATYNTMYNVTGSASAQLTDYATIRGRLAWAYQNFLPYVFFGASIARVTWSSSVNVNYNGTKTTVAPPVDCSIGTNCIGGNWTQADGGNNKLSFGYDVGIGLDYALTQNVFLRGEIEYIDLGAPGGIKLNTSSVRGGVGLQF